VRSLLFFLLGACHAAAQNPAQSPAESFIESGHWKRARSLVEPRLQQNPNDALANYLLSMIRNAFGDRATPLALAEKAVALDSKTAKFHRQLAEVLGVTAQHANPLEQLFLARRFRKEIDTALDLDPRDTQALRDLLEFYLVAPGIVGGDPGKAPPLAKRIIEIQPPLGLLAQARIATFHKDLSGTEAALQQAADRGYNASIALARFYLDDAHFQPASAAVRARQAVALDPTRVDAYAVLAETQAHASDWTALEATLSAALAAVPDDLTPYFRAATRLIADHREPARAEQYLHFYLGQEPEGNAPTATDAHAQLERIHPK
jgi:hypothetical protein